MRIHLSPWMPAPRPAPAGETLMAIGDIHGMVEHQAALEQALVEEFDGLGAAKGTLVRLGDYIDRGPESAAVLHRIAEGLGRSEIEEVNLVGNHDAWLVAALDGSATDSELGDWAYNGGLQALESFGISPAMAARCHIKRELETWLPRKVRALVASLVTEHRAGGYYFVHAGLDPRRPLTEQSFETKTWIRDVFLDCPAESWPFSFVVVHGHTPDRSIGRSWPAHRIGLDSGCFKTGIMTGLVIHEEQMRLVQVSDQSAPTWLPVAA